jgi:hypothetical protein
MSNITITRKEYNALVSKSKAGWKFYYDLLNNDFDNALGEINDLKQMVRIISNDQTYPPELMTNIQRLLDGHRLRITCVICLEENLTKENAQLLGCLHRFHKNCLATYRTQTKNYKCPQCRQ